MRKIDAQQHIWQYNPFDYSWLGKAFLNLEQDTILAGNAMRFDHIKL